MTNKPLVVLGAGRSQAPLIAAARDAGFAPWVFDVDPTAPGVEQAERFGPVSARDPDAVLSRLRPWATEEAPVGVVTTSTHPGALLTTALVAATYEVAGPSLDTLRRVQDRGAQRSALELAGVAVPSGNVVLGEEDAVKAVKRFGRAYVKPPLETSGALGVALVEPFHDAGARIRRAAEAGDGRVIVEEVVEGPEYSVDAVAHGETVHVLCVHRKEVCGDPLLPRGYHTIAPEEATSVFGEVASMAAKALGISDVAFNLDVVQTENGPVVIEVGMSLDSKIDRLLAYQGADGYGALFRVATRAEFEPLELGRAAALRFVYADDRLPLVAEKMSAAAEAVELGGGAIEWQLDGGTEAVRARNLADTLGWITCNGLDGEAAWARGQRLAVEVCELLV